MKTAVTQQHVMLKFNDLFVDKIPSQVENYPNDVRTH